MTAALSVWSPGEMGIFNSKLRFFAALRIDFELLLQRVINPERHRERRGSVGSKAAECNFESR